MQQLKMARMTPVEHPLNLPLTFLELWLCVSLEGVMVLCRCDNVAVVAIWTGQCIRLDVCPFFLAPWDVITVVHDIPDWTE